MASCSVGNVVFTALMFSFAVVGLHGATRVPDDLFLDDTQVSACCPGALTYMRQSACWLSVWVIIGYLLASYHPCHGVHQSVL